jgi:hypothetical protein
MAAWVRLSGRPFLVSEWYAMSVEPGNMPQSGAGFRVRSDAERGLFYQNMTLGLLRDPGCVGWHWFKYGGDEAGAHKGVVNPEFGPHQPLLAHMREINGQVYQLADYFHPSASTTGRPDPVKVIFDSDIIEDLMLKPPGTGEDPKTAKP